MNQVNLALSEVRQAARDINDEIEQRRQEITALETRLSIMVNLRTSMEEAVDALSATETTGPININADVDLDDTQEV